jgi:predicted transcriptional regulator
MEKEKPGRKQDFPGMESDRLSIRLPKETIVALEIFAVTSSLTRNQLINQALQEFLESKNKA